MSQAKTDDDLFKEFVGGSKYAYDDLFSRHWGETVRMVKKKGVPGGSGGSADDVAQDVWMELFTKQKELSGTNFMQWLNTYVGLRCDDWFKKNGRKRKREDAARRVKKGDQGRERTRAPREDDDEYARWEHQEIDETTDADQIDESSIREEQEEAVGIAVSNLNDKLRATVKLIYEDGLSREEAAAKLEITVDGIDKRLQEARAQLKQSEAVQSLAT